MSTGSTTEGWHVLRGQSQAGPYTWEQLYGFAQAGHIAPEDLVWHESLTDWTAAGTVPGLFTVGAPTYAAAAVDAPTVGAPTYPAPGAAPSPTRPPRKRGWVLPLVAVIAAVVVIGGAAAGFFLWRGGDGGGSTDSGAGTGLGTASYTPPTPTDIVETQAWGNIPINQLAVILLDGKDRDDAEKLAESLGGAVVGEMEFINLYQLQVPAASESELAALLDRAKSAEGVELAFPNQELTADEEIWGVRSSPLDDPVYEGDNGKPYAMTGVQRAWDIIRGAGRELNEVNVGVIDTGLYRDQGEFGSDVTISTGEAGDELGAPQNDDNGNPEPYGGHGTAVAGIIGADPGNGGQTGVASILGGKLKMTMTNLWGPVYGTDTVTAPDPNDPTKATYGNTTYALGGLRALQKQVDDGATIINCSWGAKDPPADAVTTAAYRRFFEKMAREKPDVIFVAAAGNDGSSQTGSGFYPGGAPLPNMITVGNLDNDGSKWKSSNTNGQDFEVTLGAPGHRVVSGVGPDGTVSNEWGGTSFATPQVTATVAMMRSLNPNLTAAQIKEIITQTAAPGVTDDEKQMSVPFPHDELGAGVLRVDLAVAKVVYDLANKDAAGKPTETAVLEQFIDNLQKAGVIDAVAVTTDDPQAYDVRGIVEALGDKGTDVTVSLSGQGAIGGDTSQHLAAPGDVTWSITVLDQTATITVRRTDNGAASVITVESIDLNGHWEGTFTIGAITLPPGAEEQAAEEGCDLSALKELEGTSMPMTMDITADPGGGGVAIVFVDSSGLSEDGGGGEPQTKPIQWNGNSLTMDMSDEGATGTLKGRAARQGDAEVITGSWSSSNQGLTMSGTWTVTKQ
ncbi:MAG: S8 family serine peptidase [Thermoleophilia bacterium]